MDPANTREHYHSSEDVSLVKLHKCNYWLKHKE